MLVITKQSVDNLIHRLRNSVELEQCQTEVSQMLAIESDLLWWADSGKCCVSQAGSYLTGGVQILQGVLDFIKAGDIHQASSLLEEYSSQLKEADGDRWL